MTIQNIQLQNVYQRIGVVEKVTSTADCCRPEGVAGDTFGVIFAWPAVHEYRFFSLAVQRQRESDGAYQPNFAAVQEVAKKVGFDVNRFTLQDRKLVAGLAKRGETLRIVIRIDTDDSTFKRWSDGLAATDRSAKIAIQVVMLGGGSFVQESLEVRLSGCGAAPDFHGFIAVDLGNTTSSLAVLRAGDTGDRIQFPPDVQYAKAGQQSLGLNHTTPSLLSLEQVLDVTNRPAEQQEKILSEPGVIRWEIGVASQNSPSLILGPKRRAARPGSAAFEITTQRMPLPNVDPGSFTVRIPPTLPAELFIARHIQMLQSIERCRVGRVAMTYPTSYSSIELKTLRAACARAVRRARWEDPVQLSEREVEGYTPLALDEATAAAFYFLNKEVFEKPGALRRFRWFYPQGFNLLVYDCGGGTTDISLVKAESPSPSELHVRVLGRAGDREFGGDQITICVFRLLKSRLALALAEELMKDGEAARSRRFPQLQSGAESRFGEEVASWYRKHGDWVEQVVPLRRTSDHGDEAQRRESAAVELWRLAEKVKHDFSGESRQDRQTLKLEDGHFVRHLCRHHSLNPEKGEDIRRVTDLGQRCNISRAEVDALIVKNVRSTIRLCNKLIRTKLWSAPRSLSSNNPPEKAASGFVFRDCEVHQVCLAGNGSRYPLIPKLLREELKVLFLDDERRDETAEAIAEAEPRLASAAEIVPHPRVQRFMFDESNPHDLKNAVAKGAVLAMASQEGRLGIYVEFESRLFEQLPFDVGYRDFALNSCKELFREGERYTDDMVDDRKHPVPPPPANAPAERTRYVYLDRRWPGDDKWEPFLRYYFERPISGDVTVGFDQQLHDFVVRNEGRAGTRLPPEGDDESHLHPVQRRTL